MAWKPKTIAGKILKGALIGGASLVGAVTGVKVLSKVLPAAVPAIKTAVNSVKNSATAAGTTILTTVGTNVTDNFGARVDAVKESATKLITGTVDKAINAVEGAKAESRQAVETVKKTGLTQAGLGGNTILYIGAAIIAMVFLPKLLNPRRR